MTTADAFDRFAATADPAMIVVTVGAPERSGCLVGFHTQASMHPRRYLVYLSRTNHTHAPALAARHVGVHLLGADQHDLAALFGAATGDEIDKFARCRWESGPEGVPVLAGVVAWFVGRVVDHVAGGDHDGLLLEPIEAATDDGGRGAIRLGDVTDLEPGHRA